MTVQPAILSVQGVRKGYGAAPRRLEVLRGVDLRLERGDSVSIRGTSGSGKSTLLHLLAGLDRPDAGEIYWEGGRVEAGNSSACRRADFLGMVFQSFHLVPEMDAMENILLATRIAGIPGRAARARAAMLLERLDLGERAHHLPGQLSGGERQRVALARALVNSPRLLLADEPTGNLDEATGAAVIAALLGLCAESGAAVILVTHHPGHASRTRRQFLLQEGELVPGAPGTSL